MSRSPAMSGKAMATKLLKEKWLSRVQSAREKGENGIGGGFYRNTFIHLNPRLNDQTSGSKRARVLQRSWTTERGKDVQLDSHQQCAQGYCKLHRCGGDRIDCDVPSYDRNYIDVKDKWRRSDPEWIGDNGDRYRRGSPLDSD